MKKVLAQTETHQIRCAASLRTSELLREVARVLHHEELAFELRVRARWIEVARHDEGVSQERRMGLAAIEDIDALIPTNSGSKPEVER